MFKRITKVLFVLCFIQMIGCQEKYSEKKVSNNKEEIKTHFPYVNLKSDQNIALTKFLAENKDWQIAESSDNTSSSLQEYQQENPGYEPYFVNGDMTGDGISDFAVVLKNGKIRGLVFFKGLSNNEFLPQWLSKNVFINTGGLFAKKNGLWLGEFYTDNISVLEWDSKKNMMVYKK